MNVYQKGKQGENGKMRTDPVDVYRTAAVVDIIYELARFQQCSRRVAEPVKGCFLVTSDDSCKQEVVDIDEDPGDTAYYRPQEYRYGCNSCHGGI